jgi:hypothetical protein
MPAGTIEHAVKCKAKLRTWSLALCAEHPSRCRSNLDSTRARDCRTCSQFKLRTSKTSAITLLEITVVIGIIVVLAGVLMVAAGKRPGSGARPGPAVLTGSVLGVGM